MIRRLFALGSVAAFAAGCSASSVSPVTPSGSGEAYSAVRAPGTTLERARRGTLGIVARPYPISALAFPISALAFPISALAFAGSGASTLPACPSNGSNAKSARERERAAKDGGDRQALCKSDIDLQVPLDPDPNAPVAQIGGVQPGLLQKIYNVSSSGSAKRATVALVVAYDDPKAESDLAVYRTAFDLKPCTTQNLCFQKISGAGGTLPPSDANWSVEAALDLDAVSAVCPDCKLMLVEAASNSIVDLAAAVDTAVANGATVVSNSYGVSEAADNVVYASHYRHAGVPITAAAGDLGFGPQFPASVPEVTSVGGTSVQDIGNGAIQEVAWPLSGGGCSAFFAKPAWQHDTLCAGRTLNDIAMIADPSEGISVYDSTIPGTASGGWFAVGGTSLGAPLAAAIFAIAAESKGAGSNAGIYATAAALRSSSGGTPSLIDVTSGSNGPCPVAALCTAGIGYDSPTGNGVPWGANAFAATQQ